MTAVLITPVTLSGEYVRLEPLNMDQAQALNEAAADGDLWKSTVTIVPTIETMAEYINEALRGLANEKELPFVIVDSAANRIVGTTRFYEIEKRDRRAAIGYTWLALSAQRTMINTEAKLLLLSHAFESWRCVRVELITDVLNEQSRKAILRLGAQQEGILRQHMIMPNGRVRNSVVFSIIDSEWPDVKARLNTKLNRR